MIKVPKFSEFSVTRIWDHVMNHTQISSYLPEHNYRRPLQREYLFNVSFSIVKCYRLSIQSIEVSLNWISIVLISRERIMIWKRKNERLTYRRICLNSFRTLIKSLLVIWPLYSILLWFHFFRIKRKSSKLSQRWK